MESSLSTSAGTVRALPVPPTETNACSPSSISSRPLPVPPLHPTLDTSMISSQPSSPRSSALPSPPDSPDSTSSFPSLSSSFFVSSAAASPPHPHPHDESVEGLVIPSLTLPSALRQPTVHGKTLGDVRLIILGGSGGELKEALLDTNEDVVDIGPPEFIQPEGLVRTLASTDWVDHRDPHGLDKFEPMNNIELFHIPTDNSDVEGVIQTVLTTVHRPFHEVSKVIHPQVSPSALLSSLVSSPSTPLYTSLILLTPALTPSVRTLIDTLSPHIPVILLPQGPSNSRTRTHLSLFRPSSPLALRQGLFRSPETLAMVRGEATDRFLRWREVERAVGFVKGEQPQAETSEKRTEKLLETGLVKQKEDGGSGWSKAQWEAEWDATLSHNVARRLRESTITSASSSSSSPRPSFSTRTTMLPLSGGTKHTTNSHHHNGSYSKSHHLHTFAPTPIYPGSQNIANLQPSPPKGSRKLPSPPSPPDIEPHSRPPYPRTHTHTANDAIGDSGAESRPHPLPLPLDPLYLPSLLAFSASLWKPMKDRLRTARVSFPIGRFVFVFVGAVCAGIGIGMAVGGRA